MNEYKPDILWDADDAIWFNLCENFAYLTKYYWVTQIYASYWLDKTATPL
jgi:hypothetical protein